jgi:hypothetical protein
MLQNTVLANINEDSTSTKETNWREEMFKNMELDQVKIFFPIQFT